MTSKFFEMDFKNIFPNPTGDILARSYFNRLYRKLHVENFSLLIIFYGKHRSGKSESACSFADILDPTFEPNLEKRVVFTAKEFLSAMQDIRDQNIKGGAVIFDESGSGELSSQRWYEDSAKIISAELQAVGYLNPFICFVTQNFSFINVTARKLSQGVFEVSRVHNEFANIKPFWIENNPWIHGFFRRYPLFCENKKGIPSNIYKLNNIKIHRPREVVLNKYIRHSQAYKDKLLENSKKDIEAMEFMRNSNKALAGDIEGIVTEIKGKLDYYKLRKKTGTFVNEDLIRHDYKLTAKDARLVKVMVEKDFN